MLAATNPSELSLPGNPDYRQRMRALVAALCVGVLYDVIRTHDFFESYHASRAAWLFAVPASLIAIWCFANLNGRKSVLAWFTTSALLLVSAAVVFYGYRAGEGSLHRADPPELFNFVVLIPLSLALASIVPIVVRDGIDTTRFLPSIILRGLKTLARIPDAIWETTVLPRMGSGRAWGSITVGLIVSIPVCGILAGLLAADAQFDYAMSFLVEKLGASFTHFAFVLFAAVTSAFFLMLFRGRDEAAIHSDDLDTAASSANVAQYKSEVDANAGTELAFNVDAFYIAFFVPVVGLFAVYAVANLPSFFLSDALIRMRNGPSYAEHLHRGFAESVTASMLACALVWAELAMHGKELNVSRGVMWMQAILLVLASLAVFSCGHRLYLYVHAYGLTPKRVFVGFFVLCALGSFLLTGRKVLRRDSKRLSGELFFFYVALGSFMGIFPYFLVPG